MLHEHDKESPLALLITVSHHTMTIRSLLLLLQAVNVAAFTPELQQLQYHYEHKDQDHGIRRIVSNEPGLQYSLTVEDWHTASQLHPLDDLGVIDDESSSAIMGLTDAHDNDSSGTVAAGGSGRRSGTVSVASRHPKMAAVTSVDVMREFIGAFFPVILLILLEIYSQQLLQYPLA